MFKKLLLSGALIFVAWMAVDLILHRFLLAGLYEASSTLWRPFDQINVALVYAVTLVLIGVFLGIYARLVHPKSLSSGIELGALLGVALGTASGFGTYLHSPIPLALALGWFLGGCLKGLAAGALLGVCVSDNGTP